MGRSKKENVLKEMFGKVKLKKSAKKVVCDFRKNTSKWLK
jgi:hypothetical protein